MGEEVGTMQFKVQGEQIKNNEKGNKKEKKKNEYKEIKKRDYV
jgi:hypothetical protein